MRLDKRVPTRCETQRSASCGRSSNDTCAAPPNGTAQATRD
jgi:hypothetical protein